MSISKTIEFIKQFKNENPHLFTHDSTWINIMNNSEDLVPSQSNKNACKTYDIIIKKKSMTTLQMVLETSDNITKVGEFFLHAIINEIHNNEYMIIENSNDKYMDMIRCILSKKINENIKKSKENIIKKSEENTNEKYIQDSYEYFLHDHQHESQDYKSNIHYI